ncbi:MAG: cytochrome c oxidase accessory protein CcoG [Verrucomicrobiae bacterium]|nr:cytochrome c oxidase accessory protein CcoG [Verrucomicrobiae bacterium]
MSTRKVQKKPNLDSVTTINEDGSRYFLHPADVRGSFTKWRRVVGAFLLLIYVALPWIPINGYPAVFFNLAERRFHLFGLTFVTEDLWLAFFLLTGLGFGLFYITALAGRLWCGWTCPYTVFLEHIYRRIERFIDGDAPARRKLDAAPWTGEKITKRVIKHSLYFLVSAAIAHVFLSYFVSIPRLYEYMQQSPVANAKAFGVVTFLTLALYGSFAWFREQFCIIMCPYGRIQSALTDDNTMVIGYDANRGEPRGKASDSNNGDCINCSRCVQVCPTGIDIRNGLQLECIGCAACVDACDEIMEKLDRPKGLVRYDSLNGLAGKARQIIRPRIILYTGFLMLGAVVLTLFVSGLHSADAEVGRLVGQPFYVNDQGVRNQFELRMVNKRNEEATFKVHAVDPPKGLELSGVEKAFVVPPQGEVTRPFFANLPAVDYKGRFTLKFEITVQPGDITIDSEIVFLGPSAYQFKEQLEAQKKAAENPAPKP